MNDLGIDWLRERGWLKPKLSQVGGLGYIPRKMEEKSQNRGDREQTAGCRCNGAAQPRMGAWLAICRCFVRPGRSVGLTLLPEVAFCNLAPLFLTVGPWANRGFFDVFPMRSLA